MRKVMLAILVAVVALVAITPSLAQPAANKDNVRLRMFVHYPRDSAKSQPPSCNRSSITTPSDFDLAGWRLAGNTDYYVNVGSIPAGVENGMMAIRNSFQVWAAANGRVSLVEGTPTTVKTAKYDGQNVVAWGNVSSGNAIAVTYTWYDRTTGHVLEVDTIMSSRLSWRYTSVGNPDLQCGDSCCYDVQDILTHEIGHWMGLDDLYNAADKDLTLYGYGAKGELKKDTLGLGDVEGIRAIY